MTEHFFKGILVFFLFLKHFENFGKLAIFQIIFCLTFNTLETKLLKTLYTLDLILWMRY
jgi:hypothetical protein